MSLPEARTTATMVLLWIGFLVLSVIAAPLTTWRLVLVWTMPALFVLVMAIPATREFFALYPPPLIVWLAAFGIASLVWSLARLLLPPERPVGPGAPMAEGQTPPTLDGGQITTKARPITLSTGTNPRP